MCRWNIVQYIDFSKSEFVDYNSKEQKATTADENQNNIDNFNRYAGAYLANADYDMVISSMEAKGQKDVDGNSCIFGSYDDGGSKAEIYIQEQYGVVMKFDFSMGNNRSLSYITNFKAGSVTDQDVELPQEVKVSKN